MGRGPRATGRGRRQQLDEPRVRIAGAPRGFTIANVAPEVLS